MRQGIVPIQMALFFTEVFQDMRAYRTVCSLSGVGGHQKQRGHGHNPQPLQISGSGGWI